MSSPFQVHFLGSGAALPTTHRAPTAQYIVCNNRHLLIDCGEGTQMQMRKYGVHFQKITTIFISHLHGDHYFGLVGLLSTMNLLGRTSGLTVYGPPLLEEILRLQFESGNSKFTFNMQFVPLEMKDKTLILEDRLMKVYAFPLKHRVKTFGFIIEENFEWSPREVDLSEEGYDNQTIYIAFVNKTYDGFKLYLDDMEARKEDVTGVTINLCNNIFVYPNPSNDKITFSSDYPIENITILSASGSLLHQTTESIVDISHYPVGLYYARIISNKQTSILKIIKD